MWLAKVGCGMVSRIAPEAGSARSGSATNVVARQIVVAVAVRVVDEEEAVVAIPRMEGDAEQAALAAAEHDRADVEERRGAQPERVVDADRAGLLGDEEPRVAGMRQRDRLTESGGDRLQRDFLRGRRHCEKHENERDGAGHDAVGCNRFAEYRIGGLRSRPRPLQVE